MKARFHQVRRWMGAWGLGTFTVWIARDVLEISWPVALLVGGLIIGLVEAFQGYVEESQQLGDANEDTPEKRD